VSIHEITGIVDLTPYGDKTHVLSTLQSSDDLSISVRIAGGTKCARCWNYMPEVSAYGIWQNVCNRCQSALTEMKIAPPTEDAR
jgi:isoleucyl-tRNA synthetase